MWCDFETGYWIEDSGRAMVAALHEEVCVSQHARDLIESLIGTVMLGSWWICTATRQWTGETT